MKFLADENVDQSIVELLRKNSYKVLYILEMEPGISDDNVIQEGEGIYVFLGQILGHFSHNLLDYKIGGISVLF